MGEAGDQDEEKDGPSQRVNFPTARNTSHLAVTYLPR